MKNRITLGILFTYIILASIGCYYNEPKSASPENPEIKPVNQVNTEDVGRKSEQVKHEIDGQWIGVVNGADGKELELIYMFKAEGDTLLGLIESRLGGGPISEGKINDNNIEFTLHAGGDIVILNNGTLSGDEIRITQTTGKEKTEVVLKRVKR